MQECLKILRVTRRFDMERRRWVVGFLKRTGRTVCKIQKLEIVKIEIVLISGVFGHDGRNGIL